jgi:hypothetical protein
MALRGAEIITDDLILLSDDMRKVYTIALPLGLKEGSWNTDHVSLPVFMHPFGKPIKFLKRHEVSDANHSETLTPISRILFPNFSREAPASSRQLTICETFAEISRAGFFCPGGSYATRLETLLESLRQTPAHLISYGSTAEAIRLIDEIS